ncbi:MAG TPA: efflux RND transporter periplasmic adaptor subunit [Anaerolineales bacterium]|nr:efflux RND transporter periplasmic adaptor subunit [Anaerolineales bacterium]
MLEKFSKRTLLIVGVILILVVGSGFAYYNFAYLPAQTADEPEIQTATVRQGELVIYASGSGVLIAGDEIELGFGTNGPVAEIHVQPGDQVMPGDVLAVQGEREQLEAAVAADKLTVINAQQSLDAIYENADITTAQAQIDLANAQDELNTAEYTNTVQQEGNRASQATIDAAAAELEIAEDALTRANENLNHDPDNGALQIKYANARSKYQTALGNWNWYTGQPTEIQQALLDAELAMTKALLRHAELEWERLKDGPDADEVTKAELQLANAEAKLAISQRNLEQSVIIAPMDGTVMTIDANVGQQVSGVFISLADLSQPYLEVFLDETDLDKIDIDYAVEVVFDALPDEIFKGSVVQVDPGLYSSQNVSAVRGLVKLNADSAVMLDSLLIGMNAAVDVIGGKAEGAVLVPVEALRELSPGEYAVFVLEDGEPKLRIVEVGLMDFSFAEIKSGLKPGDIVTTGIVETE